MKKQLHHCFKGTFFLFSILILLLTGFKSYSQAPTWVSNTAFGSSVNENARGSCIDASGNVYYTGIYNASFSFGSFTLPAPMGLTDVFIVKYNSAGVCQWVNRIGSSGTDGISGIVADAGGVYVVGQFSTNCTFGGTFTKTTVGSSDAYVAKLNPSTGVFVWVNTFGCSTSESGNAICLDGSNGVYATGTFAGSAGASTIASGPSSSFAITPTSANSADIFVARFDRSTGYCTWWDQPSSSSLGEIGKGICYTKKNLVVVGNYSGNAVLGGITLPAPSGSDVLIATLDTASGTWLNIQTAGATLVGGTDVAVACDYDTASKATYITGYFGNGSASSGAPTSITFGGTTLTNGGSGNMDDIFVLRYDHINNTFKWAKNYGGSGYERPQGVSFDGYGGVYIFGSDQSATETIGSFSLTNGQASPLKQSPLMFKITANDGTPLWAVDGAVSATGNFSNTTYGLVAYNVGATRDIFINGHFSPSLQFGSLSTINASGGTSGDVFLSKLTDNNTCFTNIGIEGNSQLISDEDGTPSSSDHTDFGSISTGSNVVRTFTIRNSGLVTLNVSSIGISGANSSLFVQGGLTLPTTVAAGSTITFTITYTPVSAGTHNVTITVNSNDCAEGTYNYSVKGVATSGSPLSATQSQVNIACNSVCNGSATVVTSGGVAPYTYSWSPSGGSAATASSLCAGSYTCTITDNATTQITKSFTISEPAALTSSVITDNAACASVNNGSAIISAGGGTPSYSYSWAPSGGTSVSASNLAAGNYTVTITDANSCTKTQAVVIGVNSATQTGGVAATPGGGAVSQTQPVSAASGTYTDNGCNYITTIQSSGMSPVSGNVTTEVWIENSVPTVGSSPYVARHYQITPAVNPSTSTGTVKLYFLQSEFDAFNSAPGSVLNLPSGPSDAAGIANLRVAKYSGTSSDNSGLPGSYTNGTIIIDPVDANIVWNASAGRWEVSFDVAGFSGFIVQTNTFTLPVSLVSFTAEKSGDNVLLKWQTATEANSHHFVIEHSVDGRNFTTVGTISAAGNSNSLLSYSFTHTSPQPTSNFYRLLQVDNDGHKSYSDIRKISFDAKADAFMILVNPVTDGRLQVQFNRSADAVIYNSAGQIMKKPFINAGSQIIKVDNLPVGVYMLQSGNETKKFTIK